MSYSKIIEQGIKCVEDSFESKEYSRGKVSVYSTVYKYKEPVLCKHSACFSGLEDDYNLGSEFVVSSIQEGSWETKSSVREAVVAYLDYVMHESPYSSVFVSVDTEYALKRKFVAVSTHTPSNLMVAGLVATRAIWERDYVPVVFYDLVRKGIDKHIAFIAAFAITTSSDRESTISKSYPMGHVPLDVTCMKKDAILSFSKGKAKRLNKPLREKADYHGLNDLFTGGKGKSVRYVVNETEFRIIPREVEADYVDLNPFRKPKQQVGVPYEDCIDCMVESLKEFQEKVYA